jgi:hypothetical protein
VSCARWVGLSDAGLSMGTTRQGAHAGGLTECHRMEQELGGIRVELLSQQSKVMRRVRAQVEFDSQGTRVGLTGYLGSSRVKPLAYLSCDRILKKAIG